MSDKSKQEQETNRLLDLDVREVSVVDRPANLSPFLLVKNADGVVNLTREETMQGSEQARDEAVVDILDLVTVESAEAGNKPEEPDTSSLQSVVEKAAESLIAAAATLKDQKDAAPSKEVLDSLAAAYVELQKALPVSDESAQPSDESTTGSEVEDLQVYLENDGDEQCVVVKRGAKMKKARLDQFRKAIDVLNSLLKELDGSEQDMNKDDAQKVEKTEEQAPTEKAAEQVAQPAEEKPADQPVEKQEPAPVEAPAAAPEPVAKEAPAEEKAAEDLEAKLSAVVEKALNPLVEKIDNLTKRVSEMENDGTGNGDAEAAELGNIEKSEKGSLWKGFFSSTR